MMRVQLEQNQCTLKSEPTNTLRFPLLVQTPFVLGHPQPIVIVASSFAPPCPRKGSHSSLENTAPQRIWQRIHFSLSVNVYLSSAYELAKDPSLSFPAMEAESMVMSGFRFKERCQASAESEYSTCPTRLFHQTSSFKEQQPCKPNRTLFPYYLLLL